MDEQNPGAELPCSSAAFFAVSSARRMPSKPRDQDLQMLPAVLFSILVLATVGWLQTLGG